MAVVSLKTTPYDTVP